MNWNERRKARESVGVERAPTTRGRSSRIPACSLLTDWADGCILLMTIDSIYTLCIWLFPPTTATAHTRHRHRHRHRTACPVKSPGQPRCCCDTARLFESPPPTSRPHPHPDPAIPVSSSRPISISTQISHSKSGHSDAALRLNPPPSRNTSVLPPLRNKRALAMPWAWTSSPTAMASSSSSSCFSPSSSAYASFARAASVLLSSTTKTTAYLALVALCLPMALGHDHSVENIPDGDATSPEPIVRQTFSLSAAAVFSARPQTADLTRLRLFRTRHYGLTSSSICSPLACCSLSAWCWA